MFLVAHNDDGNPGVGNDRLLKELNTLNQWVAGVVICMTL